MEDVTEIDTENSIEETEEVVTNSVDDMSDEAFSEMFDNKGDTEDGHDTDDSNDTADSESNGDVSLDDLYATQIGDADAKLDKPVLIKVDGEVIKLDTINDLRDMAERGTSVTKKFQKLADDRRALEAQLAELGQEPNVVSDDVNEVDSVATEILQSSYADVFTADVSSLPNEAKKVLSTNPQMLKGLAMDYESGFAQKVIPQVKREMAVKGISFIDAYVSVGNRVSSQQENVQAKQKVLKAEPTRTKYSNAKVDVNSLSDSDFEKYFADM